ncbi:MAG: acyl-CoA dehydrogenase family protein [Gammaproteobacteria bacterium]
MADRTFLDWPFFDEGHRQLAGDLLEWTAEQIVPLKLPGHDHATVDAFCRKVVHMLGDAGWLQYCVPEEYGGRSELSVRSLCLCREILAYASGLADFVFAMQGLGSGPISLFGSEILKQRYLPDIAAGKTIAAFAVSEPGAGSDVGAITTTATRDGDSYVINGTKTWISNAGLADHYVVLARTGEAPGTGGLSAFVVEAEMAGVAVSERIDVLAPHPLGTLRFEECRVPLENMIAAPGDGFRAAMGTLDIFRASVGAAALGFARRAFDEALKRARERHAFGHKLSDYQMTQVKLTDMAVNIDAAALLIYRAAWCKDHNPSGRITREASMAKLYATEEAQKIIDQAVQIFGGLGVVSGNIAETLYREIRALRIYEGTSEIQKLVIAGNLLDGAVNASPP